MGWKEVKDTGRGKEGKEKVACIHTVKLLKVGSNVLSLNATLTVFKKIRLYFSNLEALRQYSPRIFWQVVRYEFLDSKPSWRVVQVATSLKYFGFKSLYMLKIYWRLQRSFCLCSLHLLICTVIEIKTEEFKIFIKNNNTFSTC